MCRVRQESQDDKIIHVIDADDRRVQKSKHKDDFDEVGGPTWRNDENLKAWHYDSETNTWHQSDEAPKPCEKPEPISSQENKHESEKNEVDDHSNTGQVDVCKNNELQLYHPENHVSYIEGTMGNNELDYYIDSLDAVSQ